MISWMLVTRFDITMSRHVTTCHDMSRHVTTCHDMSRHVTTSRSKEHHDVLRHVTKTVASFCSFCSMWCARDEDLVRPLATWATESCKLRAVSGSVPAVRAPSKVERTCSGQGVKASRRQGAKAPRIHEDCASSEKSATDWTKITHD